jgi:hypothetical protein
VTTCEHCGHFVDPDEHFQVLPLPISGFRPVIYSPWDPASPIEMKQTTGQIQVPAPAAPCPEKVSLTK